jgi:heptosyltransferase-2
MPPERILVRGVNWLGDAVMTTPALARLREAHPAARITLLTPAALADLWSCHPSLSDLITFEPRENPWQIVRRLRRGKYDWGLVFPNSPRSALDLFLTAIPRRIGYGRPWRNWLLTDCVPPRLDEVRMHKRSVREIRRLNADDHPAQPPLYPARAHHIYQYLDLVAATGAQAGPLAPRLIVTTQEVAEAQAKFLPQPSPAVQWLGLNPGAAYGPAKRWPADRFVEAAAAIHRQTRCGWLVFGGPGEVTQSAEIVRNLGRAAVSPVVELAGKTTLRQLCALLRLCAVVMTNDSGPMHVAAALGTPVVALFGSTSPELTGPGDPSHVPGGRHIILTEHVCCSPCFRRRCPIDLRCLANITVERAVDGVLRILAGKAHSLASSAPP